MTTASVQLIDSTAAAAALLDATRQTLLGEVAREPNSAAGLARRLGLPRQRLNHHLKVLERHGLVEEQEQRRKGNCIERVMRSSAQRYLVSPSALGELAGDRPDQIRDRMSWAYLINVLGRALRQLSGLRRAADAAGKQLPTLTLETEVRVASAERLHAFSEELSTAIAELVTKYNDESTTDGRRFSFFLGAHPAVEPQSEPHDNVQMKTGDAQ